MAWYSYVVQFTSGNPNVAKSVSHLSWGQRYNWLIFNIELMILRQSTDLVLEYKIILQSWGRYLRGKRGYIPQTWANLTHFCYFQPLFGSIILYCPPPWLMIYPTDFNSYESTAIQVLWCVLPYRSHFRNFTISKLLVSKSLMVQLLVHYYVHIWQVCFPSLFVSNKTSKSND